MSTPTPQHCPTPRELDDLELLTTGALAPLTGFNEPGSAVTLGLPADLAEAEAVELVDPEGLPLAVVAADGSVTPLTHAQFGPFRRLYLTPAQAREQYAGATWVPVVGPLTEGQLTRLGEEPGPLVLLTLAGTGTPQGLSTVGLVRATLAGAARLPDASVVVVPLASHGDHEADHALGVRVVDNYAADDPILALPSSSVVEVIASSSVDEEVASSSVVEELASSSVVEEVAQQPSRDPRPLDLYPPEVESIIDFDRPVPEEQGLVLFFTGLSGSGKSTLARALMDRLLEQGTRTVTSLDGDVVRRNLSAGLTFSKADRETNIRRIGWVAAEISRHGGVAVCSPIAPFDETRQQVRAMVEEAGGAFFLVHVATPLEECERRDRKGLYAKARRGEIPEFTGISSPYEEPEDAAVRVDTTGRSIEAALDDVLDALRETGYLDLPSSPVEKVASGSPVEEGASGSPVEEGASGSPVEEVAQQPSRDQDTPDPQAPIKVLFVCTANICRSAFMHLYAEHLLRDNPAVEVSSAGTHGFVDHPMDATMAAELTGHGIDHARFRSRRLTTEMIDEADLVLTAEVAHRSFILDDHPQAFRKVLTLGQATEAASHLDPSLSGRALLAEFARHRGMAEARHDIADPFRRGPVAARECARQVTQLVDGIIGALSRTG